VATAHEKWTSASDMLTNFFNIQAIQLLLNTCFSCG